VAEISSNVQIRPFNSSTRKNLHIEGRELFFRKVVVFGCASSLTLLLRPDEVLSFVGLGVLSG